MGIALSVLLIMSGAVAFFMGCQYFSYEKNSRSIRNAILVMGIAVGMWATSYGIIGLCEDFAIAAIFRKIGFVGVLVFPTSEALLYLNKTKVSEGTKNHFRATYGLLIIADWWMFTRDGVDEFVRVGNWTTWTASPCFARDFHQCVIIYQVITMAVFAGMWYKSSTYRREKVFIKHLYLANIGMLLFLIPDTVMVINGTSAYPTSGLGAVVTYDIVFIIAVVNNGFAISMFSVNEYVQDTIAIGVIVLNSKYEIESGNKAAKELFGVEEFIGNRLSEVFDLKMSEAELLRTALEAGELKYICKTNTGDKSYSLNISVAKDNHEDPYAFIIGISDITAEQELIRTAEAASQAKTDFLASMSHEIRTPINILLGMNEMILSESKEANIVEYSETIDTAGKMLLTQVNDILDMASINSGKLTIIEEPYKLKNITGLVEDMGKHFCSNKGLSFFQYCDDNLPEVLIGDESRIKQIITNLLTNAVKYTDEGSISVRFASKKDINGNHILYVSVQDTGIGIKDEDVPHLFGKFERFDMGHNKAIQGTGIGLSIVKNLVELMKGKITVATEYGVGSNFVVEIPQRIAADSELIKHADRKEQMDFNNLFFDGMRILVADDMPMNQQLLTAYMKDKGLQIDTANNGIEAVEKTKNNEYDLILMDHMMPEMDGVDAMKAIRSDMSNKNHRGIIVALTANVAEGQREKYIREGFDDYLSKPVSREKLFELLAKYLYEKEPVNKASLNSIDTTVMSEKSAKKGDLLSRLTFLDIRAAMDYCMNQVSVLNDMLIAYVESACLEEIEESYKKQDWPDYERLVHGVKGLSYTIGAKELGDEAYALEMAQKRDDIEYILSNHERFMGNYKELLEKVESEVR